MVYAKHGKGGGDGGGGGGGGEEDPAAGGAEEDPTTPAAPAGGEADPAAPAGGEEDPAPAAAAGGEADAPPPTTNAGATSPAQAIAPATSTSTVTAASPQITLQNVDLVFNPMHNATTCQTMQFGWTLTPANTTGLFIDLNVNNLEYATTPAAARINRTFASSIAIENKKASWSAVDVPAGEYILEALALGPPVPQPISWKSSSFFVVTGNSTSCLITNGIPSSSSTPAAAATNAPPSDLSSGPTQGHLSKGLIAGIVVGAIAFIGILITVLSTPRLWRKRKERNWRRVNTREYVVY